jgi:hypothetical protein
MKKIILIASTLVITTIACKKKQTVTPATPSTGVKTTYVDVKPIIDASCVSCHNTGSRDGVYNDYSTVKASVDKIVSDISSGNMPRGASKLPQTSIDKVKQWQADGLLEK